MNVMNITFHDGTTCYALTEASLPSFVTQLRMGMPLDCTGAEQPQRSDAPTVPVVLNWDYVAGVTLVGTL